MDKRYGIRVKFLGEDNGGNRVFSPKEKDKYYEIVRDALNSYMGSGKVIIHPEKELPVIPLQAIKDIQEHFTKDPEWRVHERWYVDFNEITTEGTVLVDFGSKNIKEVGIMIFLKKAGSYPMANLEKIEEPNTAYFRYELLESLLELL